MKIIIPIKANTVFIQMQFEVFFFLKFNA